MSSNGDRRRSVICHQPPLHLSTYTPVNRAVGKSPIGVVFGILWNGGVVRVNVATLKGVEFGISRTISKRLGSVDRQNGTKKKVVSAD